METHYEVEELLIVIKQEAPDGGEAPRSPCGEAGPGRRSAGAGAASYAQHVETDPVLGPDLLNQPALAVLPPHSDSSRKKGKPVKEIKKHNNQMRTRNRSTLGSFPYPNPTGRYKHPGTVCPAGIHSLAQRKTTLTNTNQQPNLKKLSQTLRKLKTNLNNILQKKIDFDEIDVLFLLYAKILKRMPKCRQALVKFDIAKVLINAEYDEYAEKAHVALSNEDKFIQ